MPMSDESSFDADGDGSSGGYESAGVIDVREASVVGTATEPVEDSAAPVPGTMAALEATLPLGVGPLVHVPAPTVVLDPMLEASPDQPPLYAEGDAVTRTLCAHAHLYQPLAKQVCETMLGGQYQGPAPVWGVDLVALMRHCRESMQRWDARDQQLRWVTLVAGGIALLDLASWRLGALPWRIAVAVLVAVPVFVLLVSYVLVLLHYAGARARAVAAVKDTATPIRDQAGAAVSAEDVAALEELAVANVVTFDKSVPFVGDGLMLENWTLSIDLDRARRLPQPDDVHGAVADPLPVTASGLYDHLVADLRRGPVAGVRVEKRLYVRGSAARKVEGLCEGWTHAKVRPHARISPAVVDSFVDAPAVHARTYVAAQRITWGGQIVVTLLVQARRNGSVLHIEGSEHVQPPLKARYAKVADLPDGRWRVMWTTALAAWRSTPRMIGQCWPRLRLARRNARNWAKFCRKQERRHREGVIFNYGASDSLRDALSDPGRLLYFGLGDKIMLGVPLRRAVLRAVAEYVDSCGYDVADLREQEKQIDMVGVVRVQDPSAKRLPIGTKKPS